MHAFAIQRLLNPRGVATQMSRVCMPVAGQFESAARFSHRLPGAGEALCRASAPVVACTSHRLRESHDGFDCVCAARQ
eukprot:3026377-Pleurochrysis_carterae.AAC.2